MLYILYIVPTIYCTRPLYPPLSLWIDVVSSANPHISYLPLLSAYILRSVSTTYTLTLYLVSYLLYYLYHILYIVVLRIFCPPPLRPTIYLVYTYIHIHYILWYPISCTLYIYPYDILPSLTPVSLSSQSRANNHLI